MNRRQRVAVLTKLADSLRAQGSWCGETHIQKAVYFLQELLRVPTNFEFILYKHGPFSFDLRDELAALYADELLDLQPQSPPYGPRIATTSNTKSLQERFPKTIDRFSRQIDFVAQRLGDKGVSELERLATALYVTRKHGEVHQRAKLLHELKPHVLMAEAEAAIGEVDDMINTAPEPPADSYGGP